MRKYDFDLILVESPSDRVADRLYGYFGLGGAAPDGVQSVVLGVRGGTPYAACTVEADTFDAALLTVFPGIQAEGLLVDRVEVDREGLEAMVAA